MLESGPNNEKSFMSVVLAPRETAHAIQLGFWRTGKRLSEKLSSSMLAKDKTGRTYVRKTKGGRRKHRASAAGQTAANMSGRMRKARSFAVKGSSQLEFGIKGAPYAKFLEKGTSKMAARPSLGNAVRDTEKETEHDFLFGLEKVLT